MKADEPREVKSSQPVGYRAADDDRADAAAAPEGMARSLLFSLGAVLLVAAILVPLLYVLYLYEVRTYRDAPVPVFGMTLGAGVVLTGSTPLYDPPNGTILKPEPGKPLVVPEGAVVVPGARAVTVGAGREWGLSLMAGLIVKELPFLLLMSLAAGTHPGAGSVALMTVADLVGHYFIFFLLLKVGVFKPVLGFLKI